jgi:predicted AlkP superfamily pyrophosphatase or phosphodiesterase
MKLFRAGFLAALSALSACGQKGTPAPPPAPAPAAVAADKPVLVVQVLVDQLRADLLDRYADLFTGGFKRLHDRGHNYINASHEHAATETAVGHTTLSTGVFPSRHGIIANQWWENSNGRWILVSNVGDSTVQIVGAPGRPGASPHNNQRSGFAEWLVAANPRSIVASVSGKDRGAIQPAAHVKSAYAYWFDPFAGRYVTSTYYRTSDPDWITQFNGGQLQTHLADSVWNQTVRPADFTRSDPDTAAYEADMVHTYFPHKFSNENAGQFPVTFWSWWEATPYLDRATLELAKSMVTSLNLGKDDAPDYLNVSLSATDRVGHRFGPLSREQLDNLLRLDRELGDFFDFLDSTVGRDKWTVMLTADHGVLDAPEDRIREGKYGHRLTSAENAQLERLRLHADSASDKRAAARELVASLKQMSIIGDAWTQEDLMKSQPDSFAVLVRHSLFAGREGERFSREGVEFRFIPGIITLPTGSSHGQVYWYDRHVPMIFMGPGIQPARDPARAATVDFAPTFSSILRIPFPSDLDGKVLSGVVPPSR